MIAGAGSAAKTPKREDQSVQEDLRAFVSSWLIPSLCIWLAVVSGCGRSEPVPPASPPVPSAAPASTVASAPRAASPRIVMLGDSLTAGLGLPPADAYPALLQKRADAAGYGLEVVNAGVSGDTSAGGLSRLDWALQGDVRVLVVALGGNDALRGLPPAELERNLAQIIERAKAKRISVVLAGMESPPNWGRDYNVSFHKVYTSLTEKYHVALVPFLLEGVAGSETLNQADGIHPTAEGARIVADNVWTVLKPILDNQRRSGQPGS
jgi:acyl-CoA thioesterase I